MGIRANTGRLGIGAAVASALLIALPSTALGAAFDSKVTLNIDQPNAIFKGKVTSLADVCVVGRRVLLIRIEPDGSRQIVAHTFAAADGHYETTIPMQHGNPFFAKVRRKVTSNGTVCRWDRSQTKIA